MQNKETFFFDAHTHVQFAAFEKDYKEVILRALAAGVRMINVGTQKDTSQRAIEVAHEFEGVYAAIGLHPIHTARSFHDDNELGGGDAAQSFTSRGEDLDFDLYKRMALDPKVVAIGECGLDYFRLSATDREDHIKRQKYAFLLQMKLAATVGKPLMIHCRSGAPERASSGNVAGRNAFGDLIEMLKTGMDSRMFSFAKTSKDKRGEGSRSPGVIHFFTGTQEDAKKLIDLGFSFTFGGAVTFPPRAGKHVGDYDEVVKMIPLDRILSETDAPYITPTPYRGKRNEPAYVIETVKKLAELKGISLDEMKDVIAKNAEKVFGISL